MNSMSHLLVLSQPYFVDRQVETALAEPRPAAGIRRLLRAWIELKGGAPLI